jgi:hypothetical protein
MRTTNGLAQRPLLSLESPISNAESCSRLRRSEGRICREAPQSRKAADRTVRLPTPACCEILLKHRK